MNRGMSFIPHFFYIPALKYSKRKSVANLYIAAFCTTK